MCTSRPHSAVLLQDAGLKVLRRNPALHRQLLAETWMGTFFDKVLPKTGMRDVACWGTSRRRVSGRRNCSADLSTSEVNTRSKHVEGFGAE
jgi:hypothetical protein